MNTPSDDSQEQNPDDYPQPGPNPIAEQVVTLPAPTVERLKKLAAQRAAVDRELTNVLLIALEAMGVQGTIMPPVDLEKGEVRLSPLPAPTPLNREQRRKAKPKRK